MANALTLARALANPASVGRLDAAAWTALLTIAHVERLSATLAHRLADQPVPQDARRRLDAAISQQSVSETRALWEVEMTRRALAPLGVPVVLLKGAAYAAAGLAAGEGRLIGDLDILVPHDALPVIERALLEAGWEWVKPDAYDDAYYRQWMHELPPMIHRDRDAMIDVHHTILPLTARPKPDANALIADSIPLESGMRVLSVEDRVIHAAAHLFADGELDGGLRNLWDIHCLLEGIDHARLMERAKHHQLSAAVSRAIRLNAGIFGQARLGASDRLFARRILARDGWGRGIDPVTRFGFFVRSHWIRMPLPMLARHLWTKWRMGRRHA